MISGRLDREVTIEYPVNATDPNYGTPIVTWEPLAPLPGSPVVGERFAAQVTDVAPSRSEAVRQGLTVARNQTRIRMRWRDDIDSAMRVRLHGDGDDEVLQIVGGPADVGGRKDWIEIVCEKYSS